MLIRMLLLIVASALSLLALPCEASGPCSSEIANMRSKIDAKLGSIAAAGPSVAQSNDANMHRQPTTASMVKNLAERGLLSSSTAQQIKGAMDRARTANAAGHRRACKRALADAERALPP